MKKFGTPRMAVVKLTGEDLLCTSPCNTYGCQTKMCNHYYCPECPVECEGTYYCEVHKCVTYQE